MSDGDDEESFMIPFPESPLLDEMFPLAQRRRESSTTPVADRRPGTPIAIEIDPLPLSAFTEGFSPPPRPAELSFSQLKKIPEPESPVEMIDFEAEEQRLLEQVCDSLEKIVEPQPTKTKLHLRVNHITLTASWKWRDSKDDDACGICRVAFEACCTNCKMPGDDCPLALGDCKHPFHLHCINKWTDSQPKPSCPLCRTEWKSAAAPPNNNSANSTLNSPDPTPTNT